MQNEFVEIARKADETKEYPPKNGVLREARKGRALKKSIADVEQVIKGLING